MNLLVNYGITAAQKKAIEYMNATGGTTAEYDSGGKRFKSHTFTSNGNFVVSTVGDNIDDRNKVDYLIIAGGGFGSSGGGGAGGYRSSVESELSGQNTQPENPVQVSQTTYSVVVGATGQNSSVFEIESIRGGNGGGLRANGGSGGSGGGAGRPTDNGTRFFGGAGTTGQGNNGGTSGFGPQNFGAGGGSAGSQDGVSGLLSSIRTGVPERRGRGGIAVNTGFWNPPNNSGDGGGGSNNQAPASGIVIIRYEIAPN